MVYTSDYYTTRSYSTRPVVTSYSISYPVYRYPASRVYTTAYPIYSYHSVPYVAHKRIITGNRFITPSVRVISSPIRTYTRITRSPYRVSVSPIRVISSVPTLRYRTSITPVRVCTSPLREYRVSLSPERAITSAVHTYSYRTPNAVLAREYDRIAYKPRPRIGYLPLENYLNSESFINFDTETRKIRSTAEILLREIHSPVHRRYRSTTPFVTYREPPMSSYALDSYIARITNPLRNIANDVRAMSCYFESGRKYSEVNLDPFRPSRKFSAPRTIDDEVPDESKGRNGRLQALMPVTNFNASDNIIRRISPNETILKKFEDDRAKEMQAKKQFAEKRELEEKALLEKKAREEETKLLERKAREEEEQLALQAQLAEEKLAELAQVAEAAQLAEAAKLAEEVRSAEEALIKEEIRMEEEKRQAEETRLIEVARLEEEKEAQFAEEKGIAEESLLVEEKKLLGQSRIDEDSIFEEKSLLVLDENIEEVTMLQHPYLTNQVLPELGVNQETTNYPTKDNKEITISEESQSNRDEEARLEEENKLREKELERLTELKRRAEDDHEAETIRQAIELEEIALLETEIANKELEGIHKQDAPIEKLCKPVECASINFSENDGNEIGNIN